MSNHSETDTFDLERVLAVLRRRWWVIAGITLIVTVATFVFSEGQRKEYTARTSVLFENQSLSQEVSGLQPGAASPIIESDLMSTNIQLLTQQSAVAARTAQIVGHGLTPAGVWHALSIAQKGQTDVATISATSPSPAVAAAIANTFATQFVASQRNQQQTSVGQGLKLVKHQIAALSPQQLAGTTGQALLDREESLRILANLQDGGVQALAPAAIPSSPSSPRVRRNTILGFLVGLLLGLAVAFLLERLDRRMRNVEELEETYRLPLLAAVPQNKSYSLPPPLASGHRADREVFKLLRAYLRYFNVDRELKVILVASAAPGDGKTTIARNLAEAAEETGTKTLLLEADLRRPDLAKHYGLPHAPGLSEVLIGRAEAKDAIQSVPIATRVNGATSDVSLDTLVAGHPPPNPAELSESHAMASLLSWAAEHYELVVVDTAPVGVVSDAMPLFRQADGVVLVSQLDKNTRDAAAFLRQRLVGVNAPLLGVVANGVRIKGKDSYRYGYGYGYYVAENEPAEVENNRPVGTPVD